MLQQIRDRTSGIIAGFIIAIISVPFAFWGIESFNTGGGDPVVAEVGDQKIHQSQFRNAYEQRYQQLQALLGENFRADLFDQTRFRQSVLEDMIQESMLRQFSEEAGYHANDAVLFDYISSIPAFQRDGKFSTEAYREALARQGMNVERFESQLRDSIEIDQMREAVTDTAFVTDAEARLAYQLANQERRLSYAVFDAARYAPEITVSDEEIKARYERNKSAYLAPERIKLAYVELAQDALPAAEPPGQDVLKVLYDAEKDTRFTTQEERKASHILVSFGADKAAAQAKIEDLAAQLDKGAGFTELAKQHSDDPGSKTQGGDLGWVKRGQMVQTFEQALFALEEGKTSEPVETEFGWHLIRLDDVKPSVTQPFESEEVQRQLTELVQNRERQKRYLEMLEQMEQISFEKPTSLEPVAEALDLEIKTTDWFTRAGGAGIAAQDAVKEAAFAPEIVAQDENSKPIPIGDNKAVVIRKAEYEPARQKTLEEVRDTIVNELRVEQARAKAQAQAAEVLEAARSGKSLSELAAAKGAELKNVGFVRRDNTSEDRAVIQALFKLPRPGGDESVFGDAMLASGSVAVIELSAVKDPEWPAKNVADVGRQRQQLRDATAGAEFSGFRETIGQSVKSEIMQPPAAEQAPTAEE